MRQPTVIFRILRFKPGQIEPARYQEFHVHPEPMMTVLDGLEQIRLTQDGTLIYRHCCHHASCGTCACTINGKPALTCTTHIADVQGDTITLDPLDHLTCLGDLAVDMRPFFGEMDPDWANVRRCEQIDAARTPEGVYQVMRLENCIECGCCAAGCPVTSESKGFLGPAVLAALNNEIRNRPAEKDKLLHKAAEPRGAAMCRRHLVCSRVCASKVYPARHIADLNRAVKGGDRATRDTAKES